MRSKAILAIAVSLAAGLCLTQPSRSQAQTATQTASKIKAGSLEIETPWTRVTAGPVAAGYLKITNTGSESDRLVGGTFPLARDVEVHEMAMVDNVMKMRRVDGLEIKPGQTIELKPGGFHMMFMGLKEPVKAGTPLKGTLVFAKAGTVEIEYRIAPAGATSPDGSGAAAPKQHGH